MPKSQELKTHCLIPCLNYHPAQVSIGDGEHYILIYSDFFLPFGMETNTERLWWIRVEVLYTRTTSCSPQTSLMVLPSCKGGWNFDFLCIRISCGIFWTQNILFATRDIWFNKYFHMFTLINNLFSLI